MATLIVKESVDFNTLKDILGVTDGNLASHIKALKKMEYIHINKTGRLLSYSVLAAAELAKADNEVKNKLSTFAYHIGLAFQIRDDILDIEGNVELIGKPVGSDLDNEKSTYPSLLTLEGAKDALANHINEAKQILSTTGLNTSMLEQITDLIAMRNA